MSRFHINKHGVPAPCRAKKGNCPLGGDESHFKTREEAQAHADKINEANHSILPGVNDVDNIEQYSYNEQELEDMREKQISVEYDGKHFAGEVIGVYYDGDGSDNNGIIIQDGDGNVKHIKTHRLNKVHLEGDEGEVHEKVNSGQTGAGQSNNIYGTETNFRKLTERDKEFRDNFASDVIEATLGHARAHNESYYMRKRNYENFIQDGGLEDITSRFDENEFDSDPHFDVRQNLLYYFPMPVNEDAREGRYSDIDPMNAYNAQDEKEAEKRLEDATNAIVDVHEIMQETRSQPLIRRRLAERNEDRVFERFSENHTIKSDRPSGKFYDKNVGKHASKVFAAMARDNKFYRRRHSQHEAEEFYARQGTKITNYNEDIIAQNAAFQLAKEFHDNKVLDFTLDQDNKQIVNRMRKRLEGMFPIED